MLIVSFENKHILLCITIYYLYKTIITCLETDNPSFAEWWKGRLTEIFDTLSLGI